jgi:3-keto-disaccharide hydrolase
MKRMIILSACVLITATAPCPAAEEWTELFDGTTLNGWKRAAHGVAEYSVDNGTIHGVTVEGSQNSFLASEKEYGDFELTFDVKVHDSLNSGIQIRSREKTEADIAAESARTGKPVRGNNGLGRFHGPQVEIESSPGQSGYVYGEATGLGWLSPEPKDTSHAHSHMKNGEWNSFRIVAKGPRIQTWINGKKVADLTHEGVYETHPRGKLGLQVHGIKAGAGPWDVAWRNIRIREL